MFPCQADLLKVLPIDGEDEEEDEGGAQGQLHGYPPLEVVGQVFYRALGSSDVDVEVERGQDVEDLRHEARPLHNTDRQTDRE